MQSWVDGLEAHLTERLDALGGLDFKFVHAQLEAIKEDIVKFADKSAIMNPLLATDTLMHFFSMPPDTGKLDELSGEFPSLESGKGGKKHREKSTTLEDTPEAEEKSMLQGLQALMDEQRQQEKR